MPSKFSAFHSGCTRQRLAHDTTAVVRVLGGCAAKDGEANGSSVCASSLGAFVLAVPCASPHLSTQRIPYDAPSSRECHSTSRPACTSTGDDPSSPHALHPRAVPPSKSSAPHLRSRSHAVDFERVRTPVLRASTPPRFFAAASPCPPMPPHPSIRALRRSATRREELPPPRTHPDSHSRKSSGASPSSPSLPLLGGRDVDAKRSRAPRSATRARPLPTFGLPHCIPSLPTFAPPSPPRAPSATDFVLECRSCGTCRPRDIHDYASQAPYFWPSHTSDGCPYVNRDGVHNPEVDKYTDHNDRGSMFQSSYILALAWYYTGKTQYATHAGDILRTWFITSATRMNPNLNHAQFIPCANTGRSIGIIDFSQQYTSVLDAAAILASGAPGWSTSDISAFCQ
ncbi:alginate lyase-domain-containing protein [Mycena sp. CBHHK59/15]|nr:alginate lyase-domain-containing protein [Mycena sp. CBHHK59/15]